MTMRLWLLTMGCWLSVNGMLADDVTKVDATKVQQLTFNGDQVTVKYNDGTPDATLDMATLVIDFSGTTGINNPQNAAPKASTSREEGVYDLQGRKVADGKKALGGKALKRGVYIVKGKKVKK